MNKKENRKIKRLEKNFRILMTILTIASVPVLIFLVNQQFSKPQDRMRQVASDQLGYVDVAFENDLSQATPAEFKKAFKYHVLKNLLIDSDSGVSLGVFTMKNSQDQTVTMCEEYPLIELVFAAEGMAVSGDQALLTVRGPCQTHADRKHTEALRIPLQEINESPASAKEFLSEISGSDEEVKIHLQNKVTAGPAYWTLVEIKLINEQMQKSLRIDGYEVISVLGEPFILR